MQNTSDETVDWSFYNASGLTPVINVSGTMTSLGASMAGSAVQQAMVDILPRFAHIHELQTAASAAIAELTGAEAGFVTASSSAGVSLATAATLTGNDPGRAEHLPLVIGPKNEIVIQLGHLCNYGAPIEQAMTLTGAEIVRFGHATHVMDHQLDAALSERTAAGVYVVSHEVVSYGQMPLRRFAEICHAHGVPVIVDAASEYDLEGFLREGADLVIYSAHKFLGGPTAGIVAGTRDLVRAAYLQNIGIGRGMKAGKESIWGTIAALQAWKARDHDKIRKEEDGALRLWQDAASGFAGVEARMVADPTGNPLNRLEITIAPEVAGTSAAGLAEGLAQGSPSIISRDMETELGYLQFDPCNLADGHAEIVATQINALLTRAQEDGLEEPDADARRNAAALGYRRWLEVTGS